MRILLRSLVCLSFVAVASSAGATKINIFDPPGFTTNPITSSPFTIGGSTPFTACTAGELPDSSLVEDGCFAGVNRTGSNWSALELVVPNFGTSFTCNTDDQPDQIFSATNCAYNSSSNSYVLLFNAGTLANNQLFFITEDDIPPGSFPDVEAFATLVTAASTPEPSSLLLPATGLLGAGGLLSTRRREGAR